MIYFLLNWIERKSLSIFTTPRKKNCTNIYQLGWQFEQTHRSSCPAVSFKRWIWLLILVSCFVNSSTLALSRAFSWIISWEVVLIFTALRCPSSSWWWIELGTMSSGPINSGNDCSSTLWSSTGWLMIEGCDAGGWFTGLGWGGYWTNKVGIASQTSLTLAVLGSKYCSSGLKCLEQILWLSVLCSVVWLGEHTLSHASFSLLGPLKGNLSFKTNSIMNSKRIFFKIYTWKKWVPSLCSCLSYIPQHNNCRELFACLFFKLERCCVFKTLTLNSFLKPLNHQNLFWIDSWILLVYYCIW